YMAGYGLGFIQDVLKNLKLADGTTLKTAFPAEGMDLFSKLILEGHQYFVFHKNYDWNTAGRQISSPTLSNIELPASILTDAAIVFPAKATEFNNFANYVANSNQALLNPIGSKFFFKSATLASSGTNYHLNVKMTSSRVEGTECMTSAGLKNKNIALGSTPIMTKGTEYANIYPTWDWNRIPGTTAELNAMPIPAYNASTYWVQATLNPFAGGLSQGSTGIAAFSMSYGQNDTESGIVYKKAYFVYDGAMICLGNGISATTARPNNVVTSVNQCFSANNAVIFDGIEKTINSNQTTTFSNTLQWAFHENVGYVFPKSGNIVVKNDNQTGAWKDINLTYGTQINTNKVFSIWFDHGVAPANDTYEYIVMPGTTLTNVKIYIQNPIYQTVANDATVQAVKSDSKHLYGAVFQKAGTVDFNSNLVITVDKAAIVLISGQAPNYTITVSDPLYVASNSVKLTITNKALIGKNASLVGTNTVVNCTMPTGYYAGSSFQNVYVGDMNLPNIVTDLKTQKPQAVAFPNPSKGIYNLKSESPIKSVEVYNVQGQKVSELLDLDSNNVNVDLSTNCLSGIYVMKLLYSDKSQERISIVKRD
ncbi:MAG: polysaccharide lyase family 8 super-sandwich domain-containing protein, partial [Paludibacter sp.]